MNASLFSRRTFLSDVRRDAIGLNDRPPMARIWRVESVEARLLG